MYKNAIILAAGKSTRFAPFTYEKPKGLFRVKGEVLIERQVEQMIEAGVEEVYIVVGYMKEKFFYLERKYPQVHLVVNNKFGTKGNLYSLYVAKDYLKNSYLSYADYYFEENPFLNDNPDNVSYHAGMYHEGKFNMFSADCSDANVITRVDMGGKDQFELVGHAYFNETFSGLLKAYLEAEINDFRVSSLFWEEFFERHILQLTLFAKPFESGQIREFNSIDDLREFDSDFFYNVDSEIIDNICNMLHCHPNAIKDINVINAGLTNVSFKFTVDGIEYVYRHPGGTAGNLINRQAEIYTEMKAKEAGIDKSVIKVAPEGWKLSYCVQDLVECDFRKYPAQRKKCMEYLRMVHKLPIESNAGVKDFDNVEETLKLMRIGSLTKGNLLTEFAEEIEKVKKLDALLKADAKRLGIQRCYCHNDVYEPNFLATKDGDLYLIDWEYAGINDPANDVCGFFTRYDYTEEQTEEFIKDYLGEDYTEDMYRHVWAFMPVAAFYWMGWGFYKGSVGEDDGFFFLPAYRHFHQHIDKAIALMEERL